MDQAIGTDGWRTQLSVRAEGDDPARLWHLLSTPAEWPRWAPHIRRVDTPAGDGRLAPGQRLRIDSYGPVGVTATVTRVDAPRRWDFRVELPLGFALVAAHEVLDDARPPRAGVRGHPATVRVRMALDGPLPSPIAGALLQAYRPVAHVALHRLAALAADTA